MDEFVVTVSQLNEYVDDKLYSDSFLRDISVCGELVGVNVKYSNIFFALRDQESVIDCMLSDQESVDNLQELREGEKIIARGSVSIYRKSGRYRLMVRSFRLYGIGEYLQQLERLKQQLLKEGLFDPAHKRALPPYPMHVGVITSASGAVLHDIRTVSARRNPGVKLSLYAARVQGENAAEEICGAIRFYNAHTNADVLILARGGGSVSDLSTFNDEALVRAVYESRIPVVSAVGHETDFTLCDFAADVRAATPSAAAELVIPDRQEILLKMSAQKASWNTLLQKRLYQLKKACEAVGIRAQEYALRNSIDQKLKKTDFFRLSVYDILKQKLTAKSYLLERYRAQTELLNPYSSLSRGYAIVFKEDRAVRSAAQIVPGERLMIQFEDGKIAVQAEGKKLP